MKYVKVFENIEDNNGLTLEYVENILLVLKDNGISYKVLKSDTNKPSFVVRFYNLTTDNLDMFSDFKLERVTNTLLFYESLKTIMETLLLDKHGSRFKPSEMTLVIFSFDSIYTKKEA